MSASFADIVHTLSRKRNELYERKRAIEIEMQRQIEETEDEIANLDSALDTLNKAVSDYLCARCKGTGSIRKCDAAGQMEEVTCPYCCGTGIITQ